MKRILAWGLTVSLLAALAGCGSAAPTEPPTEPEHSVNLHVVTCYGADDGNRSSFEKAVAAYEEKTGNTVADTSSVSNEEWKNKVLADFITGSEPDVLFFFTNADAEPIIQAGKVVSVEEIRQEFSGYASNMNPTMMPKAADGRHYSVPSTGYWETLYVNRAVLERCGLTLPGPEYTWEQFLSDCTRLKSEGVVPIACSLFEIPHYWFEFLVMNNGTVADHTQVPAVGADGKLRMDAVAQKWIAGLNDLRFLYDSGFFPDNTLTVTDADTVAMFAEGEAAFLVDGSWKMGFFAENYPDQLEDYAVCYFPGKGDRRATDLVGGISMGYFITRKAWNDPEKREAAVEFVSHMTSREVLGTFVTTEMTALADGTGSVGSNPLQHSAAQTLSCMTGMANAVQDTVSGEAKSVLFSAIPRVVTGQMEPAEAVEQAMKLNERKD